MLVLCLNPRTTKDYLFRREIEPIPDDDGQERAKPVQNGHDRDLNYSMYPAFDVLRCFLDIIFPIVSRALRVRVCLCAMCALAHKCLLVVIEEVRSLEGFRDEEDATECPYHSDDTLYNIQPGSFVSRKGFLKSGYLRLTTSIPTTQPLRSYRECQMR